MRRAHNDHHDPDLWEVPGGKLDQGQDLEVALKREVSEEAGLEIEIVSPLAFTRSYIIPDGKYQGLPYVRLFYIGHVTGGTLTLSCEHSAAQWVSLDELDGYDLTDDVPAAVAAMESQLRAAGA